MGLIIPLAEAKAFLAWVSKFPLVGLKNHWIGSQNSRSWVSKFPSFGATIALVPTRQHVTLRHLDRYLEEPVKRVGRVLPLAAILQRLATVHFVGAYNDIGV